MKINSILPSKNHTQHLHALLDDNSEAEIIIANDGEALIRIGVFPVERYTVVSDNPDFDRAAFWASMASQEVKTILVENPIAFTGYEPITWDLLGVSTAVADYDGNPKMQTVSVEHVYDAKTFMPSLRKDTRVEYVMADQFPEYRGMYAFADLMFNISDFVDQFNGQPAIEKSATGIIIRIKYKGLRDNRHLKVNERFDSMLGKRHIA